MTGASWQFGHVDYGSNSVSLFNQILKISDIEKLGQTNLQIQGIFSHLKLWIAVAIHNLKWLKIKI